MENFVCLKWKEHSATMLDLLCNLLYKELFCDATIACRGNYYPVHRLVLSTCSNYFKEIFEQTQCKHPYIIINDIEPDELEALLNFMYRGEVSVLQKAVNGFIKSAESLKIKGLAPPDEEGTMATEDYNNCSSSEKKRSYTSAVPDAKRNKKHEDPTEVSGEICSKYNVNKDPDATEQTTDVEPVSDESLFFKKAEEYTDQSLDPSESPVAMLENVKPVVHEQYPSYKDGHLESMKNDKDNAAYYPAISIMHGNNTPVPSAQDSLLKSIKEEESSLFGHEEVPAADAIHDKDQSYMYNSDVGHRSNLHEKAYVKEEIQGMELLLPLPSTSSEGGAFELPNELTMSCPVCYEVMEKGNFKNHKLKEHPGTRLYVCPECPETFISHHTFQNHKSAHDGNYRYNCSQCTFKTSNVSHYREHSFVHTKERPFQCPFCPTRSSRERDLKRHIEISCPGYKKVKSVPTVEIRKK